MAAYRYVCVAVVVCLSSLNGWGLAGLGSNAVQAEPPALSQKTLQPSIATPTPAAKTDVSTIETTWGGVRFAMNLPTTWHWHEDSAFAINTPWDIRGFIGIGRNTIIHLVSDEFCDTDSGATAAQKRLAELPDETTLNASLTKGWKTTVRDQRVIQVDGIDAAWRVTSTGGLDSVPRYLDMVCYLRWGGRDFTIEGDYYDSRPDRTASDLDQKQAEVLAIIQSFRLLKAFEDTDSNEAKKLP